MESFRPKSCYLRPSYGVFSFYERDALTRAGFTTTWHSTSWGPHPKIERILFGFPYICQKDLTKIPQVPWAQGDVNLARQ